MSNYDLELDASNLNCPLPIMKAKKAFATLSIGQTLKIIATDPGSIKDFPALCKGPEYELLSSSEENDKYVYFVKKTA